MKKVAGSHQFWLDSWYGGHWWLWLLWPLSRLFQLLAARRRRRLSALAESPGAPVIVVGNITLGGTGKTPLIVALAQHLESRGFCPGIVSRGYGGKAPHYPYRVKTDSPAEYSGDEPLQIAKACGVPVVVDRDRDAAARYLIRNTGCDVVLSDDGLQHYRLYRDLELVVIDGERGLGNGLCLPAGPLREPPSRLAEVDALVINGFGRSRLPELDGDGALKVTVSLRATGWLNIHSGRRYPLSPLPFDEGEGVLAIAGIGNPARFFATLRDLGLKIEQNAFPDHHQYSPEDIAPAQQQVVVMTSKDAVKCQQFAGQDWWVLEVEMTLPDALKALIDERLKSSGG